MLKPGTESLGRPRSMDPGVLGTSIEEFTRHLAALGHTPLTVSGYQDGARHFAEWLRRAGIAAHSVDEDVMLRFARHECRCSGNRRCRHLSAKYVRRVRRFIRFLADRGVITMLPSTGSAVNVQITEFQDWLQQHRGLCERTVDRNSRVVMRLLRALGDDPTIYDAGLVRGVILAEAERSSRP